MNGWRRREIEEELCRERERKKIEKGKRYERVETKRKV